MTQGWSVAQSGGMKSKLHLRRHRIRARQIARPPDRPPPDRPQRSQSPQRSRLFGLAAALICAATLALVLSPRSEREVLLAWSLLSSKATGQAGKAEAMSLLARQGRALDRVDLSCVRMGGGWDAERLRCARPVDLRNLTTAGVRLSLQGADLRGADLRGAVLSQALLSEANLQGADLRGAVLRGARAARADFRRAQMQGASLEGTDFFDARLREADLRGAGLGGAALWRADLAGADLRRARLQEAALWGADLRGADLRGASLAGARLTGADFRDSLRDQSTDLRGAWACLGHPPKGLTVQLCDCTGPVARARPAPQTRPIRPRHRSTAL